MTKMRLHDELSELLKHKKTTILMVMHDIEEGLLN